VIARAGLALSGGVEIHPTLAFLLHQGPFGDKLTLACSSTRGFMQARGNLEFLTEFFDHQFHISRRIHQRPRSLYLDKLDGPSAIPKTSARSSALNSFPVAVRGRKASASVPFDFLAQGDALPHCESKSAGTGRGGPSKHRRETRVAVKIQWRPPLRTWRADQGSAVQSERSTLRRLVSKSEVRQVGREPWALPRRSSAGHPFLAPGLAISASSVIV